MDGLEGYPTRQEPACAAVPRVFVNGLVSGRSVSLDEKGRLEKAASTSLGRDSGKRPGTRPGLCRRKARADHIGGTAPSLPTAMKPLSNMSAMLPGVVTMKTAAPGLTSAAVTGAKVTIGVPGGMVTFFSPPL